MFNLLLTLSLGFELQKLFQFNFFFRLRYLSSDYPTIFNRVNSSVVRELIKVSLIDFVYLIFVLFGLFENYENVFCVIICFSALQHFIFKYIKNKNIRKISFLVDIIITILLLSTLIYYQLNLSQFIK